MKVVIVGGVAGGASAAARIRRLDESAERVGVGNGMRCHSPFLTPSRPGLWLN